MYFVLICLTNCVQCKGNMVIPVDFNVLMYEGNTALHWASYAGSVPIMEVFIVMLISMCWCRRAILHCTGHHTPAVCQSWRSLSTLAASWTTPMNVEIGLCEYYVFMWVVVLCSMLLVISVFHTFINRASYLCHIEHGNFYFSLIHRWLYETRLPCYYRCIVSQIRWYHSDPSYTTMALLMLHS